MEPGPETEVQGGWNRRTAYPTFCVQHTRTGPAVPPGPDRKLEKKNVPFGVTFRRNGFQILGNLRAKRMHAAQRPLGARCLVGGEVLRLDGPAVPKPLPDAVINRHTNTQKTGTHARTQPHPHPHT